MIYLDELEKVSIIEFLKQARHRIDGIAMYLVCTVFALCSAYSAVAARLGWALSIPYWKGLWGALLLCPITFIVYITVVYYSKPGKKGRIINAIFLLAIPFYVAYKFNFI